MGLCTLKTSRAQLDGPSHKLKSLYKSVTGEWPQDAHTALGDTRVTAELLCWMLGEAPGGLYLRGWPPPQPDSRYMALAPSRVVPRPAPAKSNQLADFVKRFPRCRVARPTRPGTEKRYVELLADVVADEIITVEEAGALEACARDGGLNQGQLEHLHRQAFFIVLGAEARLRPALLSAVRKRELLVLDAAPPEAAVPAATRYLKGWRIGLDHADGGNLQYLRELAERHGASVAKRLTKSVRFLVTQVDGSADQARANELGIAIVGPDKAEQILGEAVAWKATENL